MVTTLCGRQTQHGQRPRMTAALSTDSSCWAGSRASTDDSLRAYPPTPNPTQPPCPPATAGQSSPVGMMPTAPCLSASTTGSSRQLSEPSGSTCTNSCRRPAPRSGALAAATTVVDCRDAGRITLLCVTFDEACSVKLQRTWGPGCCQGHRRTPLPADARAAAAAAAPATAIVPAVGCKPPWTC